SRRFSYLPGNVRLVADHTGESIVLRREDHAAVSAAHVEPDRYVAWLAEQGRRTIYTPDTSVSAPPPALVPPHLGPTFRHGRVRRRRSGPTPPRPPGPPAPAPAPHAARAARASAARPLLR